VVYLPYAPARLFSDYRAWRIKPPKTRSAMLDSEAVVQFTDNFLGNRTF